MDTTLKPQLPDKISDTDNSLFTTNLQPSRSLKKGFVNFGKILLRILGTLIVVYLAFFCYVAVHEWVGHILADSLVYAKHGTYINALEVRVQWLTLAMQDGHWTVALGSFQLGGETFANSHDPYSFTEWETGFSNLMGSGMNSLVSLIALIALSFRQNVRRFPWFAGAFVLFIMIFNQILYTFIGTDPEPLVSAVLMGINPLLFKGIIIGLVLLESYLLVGFILRDRRSRRAPRLSTS